MKDDGGGHTDCSLLENLALVVGKHVKRSCESLSFAKPFHLGPSEIAITRHIPTRNGWERWLTERAEEFFGTWISIRNKRFDESTFEHKLLVLAHGIGRKKMKIKRFLDDGL